LCSLRRTTVLNPSAPIKWQLEPYLQAESGGLGDCEDDKFQNSWSLAVALKKVVVASCKID